MRKRKQKTTPTEETYIKACKKANREIELERNGGRWIAVDRPHRNKKLYNRKSKHKGNNDVPLCYFVYIRKSVS